MELYQNKQNIGLVVYDTNEIHILFRVHQL
jgi:hypothetical protein